MADDSRLPSYAVRPGVTFPDWAAVTSPATREALFAIFDAFGVERAWRDYTPAEDGVRTSLLHLYAELGRMPAIGELAKRAGVSESTIRPILASLKARDLVVLDADGERIVGAYPWTDRATEHRVSLGERTLNAFCAIDALGAGEMYGRNVEIHSRCRACRAPVRIATRDRGQPDLCTGTAGTVIAAVCCFTPVLVLLLGAVGLSLWLAWLDYVLLPALILFLGLTAFAAMRMQRSRVRGDEPQ